MRVGGALTAGRYLVFVALRLLAEFFIAAVQGMAVLGGMLVAGRCGLVFVLDMLEMRGALVAELISHRLIEARHSTAVGRPVRQRSPPGQSRKLPAFETRLLSGPLSADIDETLGAMRGATHIRERRARVHTGLRYPLRRRRCRAHPTARLKGEGGIAASARAIRIG
jgi:hypothetical protein